MTHDPYLHKAFRRLDEWRHLPAYRLERLERLQWVVLPDGVSRTICRDSALGDNSWLEKVQVLGAVQDIELIKVYIQPVSQANRRSIGFAEVADIVAATGSPMGELFAEHLKRWVVVAGSLVPNEIGE